MKYFISLNGYSIDNFTYNFNVSDLKKTRSNRKYYIEPAYLKSLYTLIKLQEKWYLQFFKDFPSNISTPMKSCGIDIEYTEMVKKHGVKTGKLVKCNTSSDENDFSDFMEYLYNRFKGDYLRKLHQYTRNGKCSYCQISRANTLDHFLPKNDFPLLSVSPWNLIPACSECNSKILSRNNNLSNLMLIHPFFIDTDWSDCLSFTPSEHFFELTGYTSNNYLKNHISTCGLQEKWNNLALSEISELREIYQSFISVDKSSIAYKQIMNYIDHQKSSRKIVEKLLFSSIDEHIKHFFGMITGVNFMTEIDVATSNADLEIIKIKSIINDVDPSLREFIDF